MKTLALLLVAASFLLLPACSRYMHVDPSLAHRADIFEVKGRNGWMLNQKLSFGPYKTGRVKRGWTNSFDVPLAVRFQGAKEKFHFEIAETDRTGLNAEVFALGKISAQDLNVLNSIFRIPLKNEDIFTAAIHLPSQAETWNMIVHDANKRLPALEAIGHLENGAAIIKIEEVDYTDNGYRNIGQGVLGFNFVQDGILLGAVETMNEGRIVLAADLPAEKRLLIAAAAAALLLRSEIGDQLDQ